MLQMLQVQTLNTFQKQALKVSQDQALQMVFQVPEWTESPSCYWLLLGYTS
ncbi:hypothetical protein D3C87_2142770 [compost metagenome]